MIFPGIFPLLPTRTVFGPSALSAVSQARLGSIRGIRTRRIRPVRTFHGTFGARPLADIPIFTITATQTPATRMGATVFTLREQPGSSPAKLEQLTLTERFASPFLRMLVGITT